MTAGIDLVISALSDYGVKGSGGSWTSRCPAHEDSSPSLTISEGKDQPVVFNCHAGCRSEDVLTALGLTWQEVCAEKPQVEQRPEITATYDYTDEAGALLFQVVRMTPKGFRQRRPAPGGGWDWKLGDVRRPLYRLREVLAAVECGTHVYVVEGEKDVEAIRREGNDATCSPGGAGKWLPEHTRTLVGAHVRIVADRDAPGREHARTVAAELDMLAGSVRCFEPLEGKDVADHLAAGHTLDDLVEIHDRWADEEAAAEADPPVEVEPSLVDRLRSILLDGVSVKTIRSRRSLVKGWLDLNSLAVLYGRSGGGKSFVAIDIVLHVVTGSWWQGNKVRKGRGLYVVAEGATGIGDRQTAWEQHNKHHAPIDGITWLPAPVNLLDPTAVEALIQVATELEPAIVVIDTLARSMSGGDENAGKDMSRVIEAADRIKVATGACVLIVHHSGKDETRGGRGWSGLQGALDAELELKSAENVLTLSTTKMKDGAEQQPLRLTLAPHRWECPDCKGTCKLGGEECDRCDGDGEIGSVAIARYTGELSADMGVTRGAELALEALRSIDTGTGVTASAWKDAAVDQGVGASSFYRHVKTLVEARLVHEGGTPARARYTVVGP